jgi:hypothetical protein
MLPGTHDGALSRSHETHGGERLSVWRAVELTPSLRQK